MKLYETDVKRFNDLVKAEPDATIYQTSFWADYMVQNGYKPLFLEMRDDKEICQGLSMLLLKKESFFSNKLTAYAPLGFLINWYDSSAFTAFHELLVRYLKENRVNKLIIEPQVDQNDLPAKKMLEEAGYVKEGDLSVYEVDPVIHQNALCDPNIVLKIRSEESRTIFEKFAEKNDAENLKIFDSLKGHALSYIACLDRLKSRRSLEENLSNLENYISQHKNDYKFVEDIAEKENQVRHLKKVLNAVNRFEGPQDPDIAAVCVSLFSDKCTIMFKTGIDTEDLFHAEKEIIDQICTDCLNRGIIKIDSGERFYYSSERKLLGRYSLKI